MMTLEPLSDDDYAVNFVVEQQARFDNNISRVKELVAVSNRLQKDAQGVNSDILRSAVVFIHATLEDFLRSMEIVLLPYCDKSMLDNIPLVKTVRPGERAIKFGLGALVRHKEKSVMDLIRESVSEHLVYKSYRKVSDIENLLKGLRIGIKGNESYKKISPKLGTLIKRRHQIVHRADKTHKEEVEPITAKQVEQWIAAATKFKTLVLTAILRAK